MLVHGPFVNRRRMRINTVDVSKKEGMSVPIPTLDFVALISLAEHALFGGFTEDGGEGLGKDDAHK